MRGGEGRLEEREEGRLIKIEPDTCRGRRRRGGGKGKQKGN